MKNNVNNKNNKKYICILLVILVIEFLFLTIVIINKNKKVEIKNEDISTIWTGSFQLAWNELVNQIGVPIVFKDDKDNIYN